jgi:hypothetical protein
LKRTNEMVMVIKSVWVVAPSTFGRILNAAFIICNRECILIDVGGVFD